MFHEASARLDRRIPVVLPKFRVAREPFASVAPHVGKPQEPHGDPHQRHPDQFPLGEEFQRRNSTEKRVLQDDDVDPRLVIAHNQIPAVSLEALGAAEARVDDRKSKHPHEQAVARHPAVDDAIHQTAEPAPHRTGGQHQAHTAHDIQRHTQQRGVQSNKRHRDAAAQRFHALIFNTRQERAPRHPNLGTPTLGQPLGHPPRTLGHPPTLGPLGHRDTHLLRDSHHPAIT